jgi:voltage-gated potassium channel Kch
MSRGPDDRQLRGDDREHTRRHAFDPVAEGALVGLSRELSLQVWEHAQHEAEADARIDPIERFRELALRLVRRGVRSTPEVGRNAGTALRGRRDLRHAVQEALRPRVPGKASLVEAEARRWDELETGEMAASLTTPTSSPASAEPRRVQVHAPLGAQLSQLFGVDVSRTLVVLDSPQAAGSTRALTRDGEVHFRPGAYQPGTPAGDWLIAHELAHVAQQNGPSGRPAGQRRELEREADRAATRAMRGLTSPIGLRAQPGAAYAFDDSEAHEDLAHDSAATSPNEHASASPSKAGHEHEAGHEHQAEHAAPDKTAHDEAEVSAVLPAEDAPPSAGTRGGGAAPKPEKQAPNVTATKPEQAMAQLRGVRPDRLAQLFGPIRTASSTDIAKQRADQRAHPPKQMSTGAAIAKPAAEKGAQADHAGLGAASAAAPATAANAPRASRTLEPKAPGAAEEKQAKQADAIAKREAVDQVAAQLRRSVQSWLHVSFDQRPDGAEHAGAKMTEQDTREMAASIDKLPTTASDVTTDPGPAPQLAMRNEAQAKADKERAELDKTIAAQQLLSRADVQAPQGEDHIESTEPTEELTAKPPAGGAPEAAPALPTISGAAPTEEVAIAAQEQHGAEIDAALAKASGDITAQRGKHDADELQARANADAQMRDLKTHADAEQETARATARAEATDARQQWQAEIDKQGTDARKQASAKIAEGMAKVSAEEVKANAEAQKHIDDGQRKAEEEKQKGERDAADAKNQGKQKSSGAWGWIKSKAKAAVDGIKHAVSAAIDACRKAVKAVIAAAKKLAMAVIEAARKVINATIQLIGDALIAISDVLLSAFPALKAKFQGLVRKAVAKAQAAVNKIAAGLKAAVQKALDALGNLLDKALQLLEKGINAIIDGVMSAVQAAIKAAQAAVEMLGTFAKLIKDVAAGPAAWIGKLGAAVVDGIKNHLWSAFKTTVIEWFKSKVFELLGVGGIVLELLLEGGLTREHITQMAMDALLVAIPAALVAILVEKLVSMIVPAAGAVMAIIEGLQAAWGTVSRIIAAFSAFVGFLLAVKTGAAGPLFAGLLAAAAVVVLDFVANWLLKKLASAARKVGAKLKGLAEKFKAKRKTKKDAKAKKHVDEHASQTSHNHDGARSPEEKHKEQIQKRVERAQRELPPRVNQLLAKKPSRVRVLAQFAVWRVRYQLSKLELRGTQGKVDIFAQVNPMITLAPGWTFKDHDVFKAVDEIGAELLTTARKTAPTPRRTSSGQLDFTQRSHPTEPAAHLQPATKWTKTTTPPTAPAPASQYLVGNTEDGTALGYRHEQLFGEVGRIRPLDDGFGSNYQPLLKKLAGVNVGEALGRLVRNERVPNMSKEQSDALSELYGLWMGGKEASHPKGTFAHQRDLTYSYMTGQLLEGGASLEQGIAMHPASFGDAQKGARRITLEMNADEELPPLEGKTKEQRKLQGARNERYDRETRTSQAWFQHHLSALRTWFAQRMKTEQRIEPREPTIDDVKDFVRHQITLYFHRNPPTHE